MSIANPHWDALRIHGELLKLGIMSGDLIVNLTTAKAIGLTIAATITAPVACATADLDGVCARRPMTTPPT
jgi:hypothetical protein